MTRFVSHPQTVDMVGANIVLNVPVEFLKGADQWVLQTALHTVALLRGFFLCRCAPTVPTVPVFPLPAVWLTTQGVPLLVGPSEGRTSWPS